VFGQEIFRAGGVFSHNADLSLFFFFASDSRTPLFFPSLKRSPLPPILPPHRRASSYSSSGAFYSARPLSLLFLWAGNPFFLAFSPDSAIEFLLLGRWPRTAEMRAFCSSSLFRSHVCSFFFSLETSLLPFSFNGLCYRDSGSLSQLLRFPDTRLVLPLFGAFPDLRRTLPTVSTPPLSSAS